MDGIIEFDLIKNQASNIIKVIGVGGGGGNAVKNMYSEVMLLCHTIAFLDEE